MTDQNTTAVPAKPNIETRIEQYVMLRDLIAEKEKAHKEAMEPYKSTLEKLNAILLNELNNVGGDSIKTSAGTCYRTVKKSASLEDGDAFMRHVIGSESYELLDRKVNVKAVEEYVAENGVLPPGVKYSSITTVGVRRGT